MDSALTVRACYTGEAPGAQKPGEGTSTKVYNVQLKSNDIGIRSKRDGTRSPNRSPAANRPPSTTPNVNIRVPSNEGSFSSGDQRDSEAQEMAELASMIASGPPSKRGSPQSVMLGAAA